MFCTTLFVAMLQAVAPSTDARQVAVTAPETVTTLDTGKLKGDLAMLAWSPDGKQFYVETVERDRAGNVKAAHHYVVSVEKKSIKGEDTLPPWAAKYWAWKSGQASPAAPAFRIQVDQRQEMMRATAAPTGGDLARGGVETDPSRGGTSVSDAGGAAYQSQTQQIFTLKLKGETIGEWMNQPVTPGSNFSWAPAPLRMIAFSKREGGPIIVLDEQGHKQELGGPKEAILPAWSDDGTRLAWLERIDRKHYALVVGGVTMRPATQD